MELKNTDAQKCGLVKELKPYEALSVNLEFVYELSRIYMYIHVALVLNVCTQLVVLTSHCSMIFFENDS